MVVYRKILTKKKRGERKTSPLVPTGRHTRMESDDDELSETEFKEENLDKTDGKRETKECADRTVVYNTHTHTQGDFLLGKKEKKKAIPADSRLWKEKQVKKGKPTPSRGQF